jgi:hypothetical protein
MHARTPCQATLQPWAHLALVDRHEDLRKSLNRTGIEHRTQVALYSRWCCMAYHHGVRIFWFTTKTT